MFINASVDLGHKITIQNILVKSFSGDKLVTLSALINLFILLPYITFFSLSGFLSDKFSRTKIIRYSSIAGVIIVAFIALGYYFGWFYFSFFMMLLLAIQSAIYSPAKYGLIKKLAGQQGLGMANGIVQSITIIAILASSYIFSIIFEKYFLNSTSISDMLKSISFIGLILLILSIIEAIFAFKIPNFNPSDEKLEFNTKKYFKFGYLKDNLSFLSQSKNVLLCAIGLSIFWGISQLIIAAFPAHYKLAFGVDDVSLIQLILAISSIGLILGSIIAGKICKNYIEMGIVPFGAFGIFSSLLTFAYSTTNFWMVFASLLFGFSGGIFIVPLNATIQYFTSEDKMGRVLAGNNFLQNIAMILALIFTITLVWLDNGEPSTKIRSIFVISGFFLLFCALLTIKFLPHLFARILVLPFFKLRYIINVDGIQNIPQRGGVLLLGNHISWIDWAILQIVTPRPIKFVMHRYFYDLWYLKWFFKLFKVIPISNASSKSSIDKIRKVLLNGEVVALFPEGHISYNGQIDEFKKGFELAVRGTGAKIIPFYLRGLWGSSFSRAQKYYQQMIARDGKRDIRVTFGKPMDEYSSAKDVKQAVFELSFFSWGKYLTTLDPIQFNWLRQAKSNLFKRSMADSTGKDLNNLKVLSAVMIFLKCFRKKFKNEKNIGIILPSSTAGSLMNLLMFIKGKIPINLNYTLSEAMLLRCVDIAGIKTIISSRQFIEKLKLRGFDLENSLKDKLLYLEDIAKNITKKDKILAFLKAAFMPQILIETLYFSNTKLNDIATILFSSGSEGDPKGIILTHKNIMANIKQITELLNSIENEVILASLPIFHSFGLTATTLLPLSEGLTSIHLPDPTDAPLLGKMAAKYNATVMFGTSTFFRIYAKNKKLNPLMLKSVRYAIAGAEKLSDLVRNDFRNKFLLNIYEAYGTTETSPVVSANMPNILEPEFLKELIFCKKGSVGLPIPGTIIKIVDRISLKELPRNERGLILIGGHQVMQGYYKNEEKTKDVIIQIDGVKFYKSGDIGYLDDDGFLYITDRISRFVKIGGEMISLSSVEMELVKLFGDDIKLSCTNLEDSKKGEKIVMLYSGEVDETTIKDKIRSSNIIGIMQPSEIYKVDEIPVLGSGKLDFASIKTLAKKLSN